MAGNAAELSSRAFRSNSPKNSHLSEITITRRMSQKFQVVLATRSVGMNLAQPPEAGNRSRTTFVALATLELSIVADATQILNALLNPGLRRPG
jgi:hypothetical protein